MISPPPDRAQAEARQPINPRSSHLTAPPKVRIFRVPLLLSPDYECASSALRIVPSPDCSNSGPRPYWTKVQCIFPPQVIEEPKVRRSTTRSVELADFATVRTITDTFSHDSKMRSSFLFPGRGFRRKLVRWMAHLLFKAH